jgi:hypothetical protein
MSELESRELRDSAFVPVGPEVQALIDRQEAEIRHLRAELEVSRGWVTRPGLDRMQPEPALDETVYRDVHISPMNSGFLVKVGCQAVAIESAETLVEKLIDYYRNPLRVERAYKEAHVAEIERLYNIAKQKSERANRAH